MKIFLFFLLCSLAYNKEINTMAFSYKPLQQEEYINYYKSSLNYFKDLLRKSGAESLLKINSYVDNPENKIFTFSSTRTIPKETYFLNLPNNLLFSTCSIYPTSDVIGQLVYNFLYYENTPINNSLNYFYPIQWAYYVLFLKNYTYQNAKGKKYFDQFQLQFNKEIVDELKKKGLFIVKDYSTDEEQKFAEFAVNYSKLLNSAMTFSKDQIKLSNYLESFSTDHFFLLKLHKFMIEEINKLDDDEKKTILKSFINSSSEDDFYYLLQVALIEGQITSSEILKIQYGEEQFKLYEHLSIQLDPEQKIMKSCFYISPFHFALSKNFLNKSEPDYEEKSKLYPMLGVDSLANKGMGLKFSQEVKENVPLTYNQYTNFNSEEFFLKVGGYTDKLNNHPFITKDVKTEYVNLNCVSILNEIALLLSENGKEKEIGKNEYNSLVNSKKVELIKFFITKSFHYTLKPNETNYQLLNIFRIFFSNLQLSEYESAETKIKLQTYKPLGLISEVKAMLTYLKLINYNIYSGDFKLKLRRLYNKIKLHYSLVLKDQKRSIPEITRYLSIFSFALAKFKSLQLHKLNFLEEAKRSSLKHLKKLKTKIINL